MNAIPLINNIPKTNINNEKQLRQEINTSLVALKKEAGTLEGLINEAAQMLVTINNRIVTLENDTVKKSDVVDVVQSGNLQPVTSNAVATSNAMPVDTVTSGDMHSVTSNAVYNIYDYLNHKPNVFADDTRNKNENPKWYMEKYFRGLAVEFKYVSIIDTPAIGGTYCILLTCIPWSDSSGGYPMQFAVGNGKIAKRTGSSNTTWGGWSTLH